RASFSGPGASPHPPQRSATDQICQICPRPMATCDCMRPMPRATPPTLTESFSWDSKRHDPGSELLHLVICWSLDEPDRIGEAARIDGQCVLGRGEPSDRDGAPRVLFHRLRPTGSVVTAPLAAPRISRVQLA